MQPTYCRTTKLCKQHTHGGVGDINLHVEVLQLGAAAAVARITAGVCLLLLWAVAVSLSLGRGGLLRLHLVCEGSTALGWVTEQH